MSLSSSSTAGMESGSKRELELVSSTPLLIDLSAEILVLIFKHLDIKSRGRLARTCSALRDILYDPII